MGCGCSTLDERISLILAKNKILASNESQIKSTITKATLPNRDENPFYYESLDNSDSSNKDEMEKIVNK